VLMRKRFCVRRLNVCYWSIDCSSKKFAFGIGSVKVALVVAEVEVEDCSRKKGIYIEAEDSDNSAMCW
jgi:hypothetical protein